MHILLPVIKVFVTEMHIQKKKITQKFLTTLTRDIDRYLVDCNPRNFIFSKSDCIKYFMVRY
jgi:hypothetical protein